MARVEESVPVVLVGGGDGGDYVEEIVGATIEQVVRNVVSPPTTADDGDERIPVNWSAVGQRTTITLLVVFIVWCTWRMVKALRDPRRHRKSL